MLKFLSLFFMLIPFSVEAGWLFASLDFVLVLKQMSVGGVI